MAGLSRFRYAPAALAATFAAATLTIVEKYDVTRRESDVSAGIRFGYSSNEIGFGWTNAAFVELLAGLESRARKAARARRPARLPRYAALAEMSAFKCSREGLDPSAHCRP